MNFNKMINSLNYERLNTIEKKKHKEVIEKINK